MNGKKENGINSLKSKFELWTKFMQSGKTAEMQKEIEKILNNNDDYFHIIFCSNNIFLCNQTASRINDTYTKHNGSSLSSSNLKEIIYTSRVPKPLKPIKFNELLQKCENHRAILCCTNKARLGAIGELLKNSSNIESLTNIIIWIDEIHSRFSTTLPYLETYSTFKNVKKIVGITATPEPVFKKFRKTEKINIKPMLACQQNKYYGFDDCTKIIIDYEMNEYKIPKNFKNNKKYINNELLVGDGCNYITEVEPALYIHTILQNKMITYTKTDIFFVPGLIKMLSHDAIREILIEHEFYVFVFNSDGHLLYKTKNNPIELKDNVKLKKKTKNFNCSVGRIMGEARKIYKLTDRPIAITGYLSLGQGNTLCDYGTEFYITKCILPYHDIKNSVFPVQVAGRCFGNLKERRQFKGCDLICRSKFVEKLENKIKFGACSEYAFKTGICLFSFNDYNKYLKKNDIEQKEPFDHKIPISIPIKDCSTVDKINRNTIKEILKKECEWEKYMLDEYKLICYEEMNDSTPAIYSDAYKYADEQKKYSKIFTDEMFESNKIMLILVDKRDRSDRVGEVVICCAEKRNY